jgi:hypothetical protein
LDIQNARLRHDLRELFILARFCIRNRGCDCNDSHHPCGTNQMYEAVAKLEKKVEVHESTERT